MTDQTKKIYNVYTFTIAGFKNVRLVKKEVNFNEADSFDMDFTMKNTKRMSNMCEVGDEMDLLLKDELK